ncbi:MAG TPA: NAD(P)-dependent oxidoreductase [Paludibacter sp.]|nr:NAD(P)-dependent oxidoreductase [Paludibacter sp.]
MQKIGLIGASGFVGTALLNESLNRGHAVVAIVRHPEKIPVANPNLEIRQGDVMVPGTVEDLVAGTDVVISAYNPGWTNPEIAAHTTKAYKLIVEEVKRAHVPRLLIVGGAGSLFVSAETRVMDTDSIPESYLPTVKALADVLYGLQKHEKILDWVFFSPAGTIVPGERTGKFRLGKDDLIVDSKGESKISVEDYAVAMLNEVENPKHHCERFTIGY